MITANVKTEFKAKDLARYAWRRATPPLQRAASMIARSAKASIKKSAKKYAPPGQPPNTRGQRRSLKKSIMYYVDKKAGWAIIGPSGYTTGQTGHFHEFGGTQRIKGKRHEYEIGSVGPIDTREGYVTKQGSLRKGAHRLTDTGVVFAKLKTQKMVQKARKIDRTFWPNAEKWHKRIYRQRPFMWPAAKKNWRSVTKIFAQATT